MRPSPSINRNVNHKVFSRGVMPTVLLAFVILALIHINTVRPISMEVYNMKKIDLSETGFDKAISSQISSTGSVFDRDVQIGGLEHDFVVQPSEGRNVIFEVKNWEPTKHNITRAGKQARFLKQATGSIESYVVLPQKSTFKLPTGVITIEDIPSVIKINSSTIPDPSSIAKIDKTAKWPIFAAMPFSDEFDDVYYIAMREAANQAGGAMRRVDLELYEGDVVDKIHEMIDTAKVVIADLSEARPNVLYEIGYARGRGLQVVPICSTDLTELPFDVRNWNVMKYKRGGAFHLIADLAKRLKSALASLT